MGIIKNKTQILSLFYSDLETPNRKRDITDSEQKFNSETVA
jgi:hypothetical protein